MLLGMKQLKYSMNISALIMVMYILQFGGERGHLISKVKIVVFSDYLEVNNTDWVHCDVLKPL